MYVYNTIVSAHVLRISLRYRCLRYALSLLAIFVKNQTLLVMYPNTGYRRCSLNRRVVRHSPMRCSWPIVTTVCVYWYVALVECNDFYCPQGC